jgi:hypothetical protein
MIVLRRNEKVIVLTGWRGRAFSVGALVMSWLLFAVFVVIFIGIGMSIGLVALLLLLPAALVALVIQAALGRRSS